LEIKILANILYIFSTKFCFTEEKNIPKNTDINLELNALAKKKRDLKQKIMKESNKRAHLKKRIEVLKDLVLSESWSLKLTWKKLKELLYNSTLRL
jgi:hypothetical protein